VKYSRLKSIRSSILSFSLLLFTQNLFAEEQSPFDLTNADLMRLANIMAFISVTETTQSKSELGRLRQELIKDPSHIEQLVILEPAQDHKGRLQGYKIHPRGKHVLFEKLGLKPGDIITDINGVRLDHPSQNLVALYQLLTARKLMATIRRNKATHIIEQSLE